MLGRTLQQVLKDHELLIGDLPEVDITDAAGFDNFMATTKPQAVIHCAAMTAVDRCETEEDLAYKLNAIGSGNVASACFRHKARLIAMSTDYVFDGSQARPYHEFDVAGGAKTVYGKTKFMGEEFIRRYCPDHLICRIAWLYGAGGPSFVHSMIKSASFKRPVLKVVADQYGNPTSTLAVARKLQFFIEHPEFTGTFHITCEGEATWFDFAREIFRLKGIEQEISPCTTDEFPRPALRPANSRLEKRMLRLCGLPPMPDWHEALQEFLTLEEFVK